MIIDCRIIDGLQGGLAFNFFPCDHAYGCSGPDVFSVGEEAFLFAEDMFARLFPDWSSSHRHWGSTRIVRQTWFKILLRFPKLRRNVRGNARLCTLVEKYVVYPILIPEQKTFSRRALLTFLDLFEDRVHAALQRHSCLRIKGV